MIPSESMENQWIFIKIDDFWYFFHIFFIFFSFFFLIFWCISINFYWFLMGAVLLFLLSYCIGIWLLSEIQSLMKNMHRNDGFWDSKRFLAAVAIDKIPFWMRNVHRNDGFCISVTRVTEIRAVSRQLNSVLATIEAFFNFRDTQVRIYNMIAI